MLAQSIRTVCKNGLWQCQQATRAHQVASNRSKSRQALKTSASGSAWERCSMAQKPHLAPTLAVCSSAIGGMWVCRQGAHLAICTAAPFIVGCSQKMCDACVFVTAMRSEDLVHLVCWHDGKPPYQTSSQFYRILLHRVLHGGRTMALTDVTSAMCVTNVTLQGKHWERTKQES